MKRTLWFMTILILVLIVLYMQPVFFPPDSKSSVTDNNQTTTEKVSSLSYDKISSSGFSVYINQPEANLQKDLGKPVSVQNTGFNYSTSIYEDTVRNIFIEANTKESVVQSIKVVGKSTDKIAPFHFGMSLTDLTDITTLFPNFSFKYDDDNVDIELSEEDMNYRPLIAFDNDTFAILFFGQEDNQLYAVDYLNKETLLQLMPYQLNSGSSFAYETEELSDEEWEKINDTNASHAESIVEYLRKIEGYAYFAQSSTLKSEADSLLRNLVQSPEKLLQEQPLHNWQNVFPDSPITDAVLITGDDLQSTSEYKNEKITVLASKPILDISFTILQWYSDPYIHSRFTSEEDQSLEIAFSKENMVVLIQEGTTNTEESSQNDY